MTVMNVFEEVFDKQDGVVSNTVVKTQSVCFHFTADQKIQHTDLLIKQSFNVYIYINIHIYENDSISCFFFFFCTVFFLYNTV